MTTVFRPLPIPSRVRKVKKRMFARNNAPKFVTKKNNRPFTLKRVGGKGAPKEYKLEMQKAKKQLAARMLMLGFEPVAIAQMYSMSLGKLRDWINTDEDFRMAVQGMEQEFFQAVEKKHQYLLFRAYERLYDLLESEKVGDVKWGIDRAFKIHGKYIERTEDMTPPIRKGTPEQTIQMLEQGIKYLEMTRKKEEPIPIEGRVIETEATKCSTSGSN